MHIVRAEVLGLCFGVRDALALTKEIDAPATVTIHGDIVHNEVVLTQLRVRGFGMAPEDDRDRLPATPAVLITAHGISDKERARLTAAGKTLIDTTCPLVARVHKVAQKLAGEVEHIVLIGRPGHVEVLGIAEDLPSVTVVPSVEAVETYPFATLGVIAQTTTPPRLADAVHRAIVARNPQAQVRHVNTVCAPTRDHQRSLETLLPQVDAVVVVGGSHSNNTRELTRAVRAAGKPAWQVADANELRPEWFAGVATLGLTAGTSTLPETVDAVERTLQTLAAA